MDVFLKNIDVGRYGLEKNGNMALNAYGRPDFTARGTAVDIGRLIDKVDWKIKQMHDLGRRKKELM